MRLGNVRTLHKAATRVRGGQRGPVRIRIIIARAGRDAASSSGLQSNKALESLLS
jgi:hypothetical protein